MNLNNKDQISCKIFFLNFSLTSKNVAYIGLRSVDPEEKAVLDELNISVFSMREIDDLGIKEVLKYSALIWAMPILQWNINNIIYQ